MSNTNNKPAQQIKYRPELPVMERLAILRSLVNAGKSKP